MPCYKKNRPVSDRPDLGRWCSALWLLFSLWYGAWLGAVSNHAHVRFAEMTVREEQWYLQAELDIQFAKVLEEALSKGVELTFLYEFQILKPQKYWFDDEVLTVRRYASLTYHALTKQYLLQVDQRQTAFDNLADAKKELMQIRDWKLAPRSLLERGESYQAALKMHLDRSKLPKALQVDALGESNWELVSPTFNWWVRDLGK